jgi:hypothetical protein
MTVLLTQEQMLEHFNVHAEAEFLGDIETTMATVADDCHYEWVTLGMALDGHEAVREFYTRFMHNLIPHMKNGGRRMYAFGENSIWQESIFDIEDAAGELTKHSSLTIARFTTDPIKIAGEHSYGSPGFSEICRSALGEDIFDVPGVTRLDLSQIELLPVSYIGTAA